jgi:hypothetical protein
MPIRHKRKLFSLLPALLLCNAVHAGLEADYELVSGGNECPTGSLQFVDNEEKDSRVLIFGGSHVWPMTMKKRSVVKDAVRGGCTYVWSCDMSRNRFTSKTTRLKCPSADHNGVVTETMVLRGKTLTYEFGFKNTQFKCQYRKLPDS